jgi:hypothetical protein
VSYGPSLLSIRTDSLPELMATCLSFQGAQETANHLTSQLMIKEVKGWLVSPAIKIEQAIAPVPAAQTQQLVHSRHWLKRTL